MDEAVKKVRMVFAAAVLLAARTHAQDLQDPTRPPARLLAGAAGAAAVSNEPQLQSVLIAREPGGRRVAVIDGETVRLGETFRGARVVRMTQSEVELMRGRERRVLKLNAAPAAEAASPVQR